MKVACRIETDEAVVGQGATRENTGQYLTEEQRRPAGASSVECSVTFTTGS